MRRRKHPPSTSEAGFQKTLTAPIFRFCENGTFMSTEHGGEEVNTVLGRQRRTNHLYQILFSFDPLMSGGTTRDEGFADVPRLELSDRWRLPRADQRSCGDLKKETKAGGVGAVLGLHRVHTSPDGYSGTLKECAETPTARPCRGQRESRRLIPSTMFRDMPDTSGVPGGHPVTGWPGDIPFRVRVSKFRTSLRQLSGCD
jgi:hypothetical protein